jgi:hypothetical protein
MNQNKNHNSLNYVERNLNYYFPLIVFDYLTDRWISCSTISSNTIIKLILKLY